MLFLTNANRYKGMYSVENGWAKVNSTVFYKLTIKYTVGINAGYFCTQQVDNYKFWLALTRKKEIVFEHLEMTEFKKKVNILRI